MTSLPLLNVNVCSVCWTYEAFIELMEHILNVRSIYWTYKACIERMEHLLNLWSQIWTNGAFIESMQRILNVRSISERMELMFECIAYVERMKYVRSLLTPTVTPWSKKLKDLPQPHKNFQKNSSETQLLVRIQFSL